MSKEKVLLAKEIKVLANLLEVKYQAKYNFKNHCYLRIAYDNTVNEKWTSKINKPFIKNATLDMLLHAKHLLIKYEIDTCALQMDNEKSMQYRQILKTSKPVKNNTLF